MVLRCTKLSYCDIYIFTYIDIMNAIIVALCHVDGVRLQTFYQSFYDFGKMAHTEIGV